MSELTDKIAQEKAELEAVPKVPLAKFRTGRVARCQVCGALVYANTLNDINAHVTAKGGTPRMACEVCYGRKR
jgi:hypothetical protein